MESKCPDETAHVQDDMNQHIHSDFNGLNIYWTIEIYSRHGYSSHRGLIMALGQEKSGDNLGKSF